jgi:hypothetical protein
MRSEVTRLNRLYALLSAAVAVSLVISLTWKPMSFEERLIRIQLEEASPGLAKALEQESSDVRAVVLEYANDSVLQLKARAALLRYPEMAPRILGLYGAEPEFQEILQAYGDSIFPPIEYFLDNDVYSLRVMRYAAEKVEAAKNAVGGFWHTGKQPAPAQATQVANDDRDEAQPTMREAFTAAQALSAERRGWYAVNFIQREGYDFLGQFVTDDQGRPKWIQSERILETGTSFFTGGIRSLETKVRTDQSLTAGDIGGAAADTFVGFGALKLLRLGRAGAASGKSVSLASRTAAVSRFARTGSLGLKIARYGKWPAIAAAVYVIAKNPAIINDTLAGAASLFGLPTWLAQLVGWTSILLPVFYVGAWFMRLLVRPAIAVLRSVLRLLFWIERNSRKKKSQTVADRHSLPPPQLVSTLR